MTNNLELSKRCERLLLKIYPRLRNFPKAEKFALCAEIKSQFYSLIAKIEMANSVPSLRKRYAQEADGNLQTIRVLIRVAKEQKYIGKQYYIEIDIELSHINKLLTGYIKSAR